jgi:FtsZ-interacting cell division protein YlmF
MFKKSLVTMLVCIFIFSMSCSNINQESGTDQTAMQDTVITKTLDTIVTFDPDTYEESVQIIANYDTVIVDRKKE